MTHVTCRLTAKNRDQLGNPTLGNRVWAAFTPLVTEDSGVAACDFRITEQEALLAQTDRATRCVTQNLVNSVYDKSATRRMPVEG